MDPIQGLAPTDQLLSVQPPPARDDVEPEKEAAPPPSEESSGANIDTYA